MSAPKWPKIDDAFVAGINAWRFDHNLDQISIVNIFLHLMHRAGAILIFTCICFLNYTGFRNRALSPISIRTLFYVNGLIAVQITLGILTLRTLKAPVITSLHVASGAAILGMLVLLILRCSSASWKNLKLSFQ